jgi:hypothetical protein
MITVLGEMAHGGIDNLGSLVFGARPRRQVSVSRWRNKAAADPAHSLTSSHGNVLNKSFKYNCILPATRRYFVALWQTCMTGSRVRHSSVLGGAFLKGRAERK